MVTITFPFLFERELNGSIFSRCRRMMEPVFFIVPDDTKLSGYFGVYRPSSHALAAYLTFDCSMARPKESVSESFYSPNCFRFI